MSIDDDRGRGRHRGEAWWSEWWWAAFFLLLAVLVPVAHQHGLWEPLSLPGSR